MNLSLTTRCFSQSQNASPCYESDGKTLIHYRTVTYPTEYIVTEEQIAEAKTPHKKYGTMKS